MKLSLSVRVAESFFDKKKATLTIDELIGLAKDNGYEALCMRASQAGTHSPPETVREKSEKIRAAGLVVSMVTADFAVPMNDHLGPGSLHTITPSLEVAAAFGAGLIRICMKSEDDVARAQRASDEAAERGGSAGASIALRKPFRNYGRSVTRDRGGRPAEFRHHL